MYRANVIERITNELVQDIWMLNNTNVREKVPVNRRTLNRRNLPVTLRYTILSILLSKHSYDTANDLDMFVAQQYFRLVFTIFDCGNANTGMDEDGTF